MKFAIWRSGTVLKRFHTCGEQRRLAEGGPLPQRFHTPIPGVCWVSWSQGCAGCRPSRLCLQPAEACSDPGETASLPPSLASVPSPPRPPRPSPPARARLQARLVGASGDPVGCCSRFTSGRELGCSESSPSPRFPAPGAFSRTFSPSPDICRSAPRPPLLPRLLELLNVNPGPGGGASKGCSGRSAFQRPRSSRGPDQQM